MSPTPIPKRRTCEMACVKHEYNYSQILSFDAFELPSGSSLVISKDDLDSDMSKLLELIPKGITIKCLDYESLLFIDGLLNEKVDNEVFLVDDGMRKSREYVDLTKLRNLNVTVPLTYLLWGVKFNEEVNTYCFRYMPSPQTGDFCYSSGSNGNEKLSLENLKKIRETLLMLSSHNPTTDLDKILLVSDFIQSRTQYVHDIESSSVRGIFITPDFPEYVIARRKTGLVETINNEQYGLCMGIANYSTMLLNNAEFDVEVESLTGCSHVWNKVLIDGKYYYFDNTWNITRSDDYHEDGLITLSFQKKYTLFGSKTAESIGHHQASCISIYNNGVLSEDDYDGVIRHISEFPYNQEPVYKSYKKKM